MIKQPFLASVASASLLLLFESLFSQDLTIKIDPQQATLIVSETCTLDVMAENVTNLGAFQFDIVYDTDVVHADTVLMHPFLGSTGRTVLPLGPDIDNESTSGKLTFAMATFGATEGPDDSGILAQLVFTSQAPGSTSLELQNVQVSDINGQAMTINSLVDGQITVATAEGAWEVQVSDVGNRMYCVDAVSELVGWVGGRNGSILRTTDGGDVWTNVAGQIDTMHFYSIAALDANNALVTSTWGSSSEGTNITYIFRTSDGGASWIKVFEKALGWLNDITMFNQTNGIASGDPLDGFWTIIETTDSGMSWNPKEGAPSQIGDEYSWLNGIHWIDDSNAWFGTQYPRAYHTTDGGASWSAVSIPCLAQAYTMAFNKSGTGLASQATYGVLAKTTDGGDSWYEITSPGAGTIRHVSYYNNRFWLLMDDSIYKSSDNGESWDLDATASANLNHLSLTETNGRVSGWCVGNSGVILGYSPESASVPCEEARSNPAQFVLSQNYPNPFNPTTTIRFNLPKSCFVSLKVYNLIGKEIETLVNGHRQAGEYSIHWAAKDLPSGLYLYRLVAGDFVETKKLVLQK